MLLTACNSEEVLLDNNSAPPLEKGKLSFVLPVGQNKTITYATPVEGKDAEYELHKIRIYWFRDIDNTLYDGYGWGDGTLAGGMEPSSTLNPLTLTHSANTTTVTITTGDSHEPSKFFIVANVNGDTINMIKSDPLFKVQKGVTTLDQFQGLLSDALAAPGGDLELLGTPIPMSLSKSVGNSPNGYVVVTDPADGVLVDNLHLKRRVARFDIINTADYSNFKILNVIVSRAQTKVWLNDSIFSDSDPYASLTGRFKVEAKAQSDDGNAFNGPSSSNPSVDFSQGGTLFSEREHHTKAAFYLYPTQLDSLNTMTEIVLEGIYNKSTPRLYKLHLPDTGALNILANNVYRIHVIPVDEKELDLKLEVIHWDDADTIPAISAGSLVIDWGTLAASADPTLSVDIKKAGATNVSYEFSTSDRSPDTLSFTTTGTNELISQNPDEQHVTHVTFLRSGTGYNEADYKAIVNAKVISKTDLTYGATYKTTHKIVLPPTDAPVEVIMKVMNAINTKDFVTVKLMSNNYGKTGYKTVHITGEPLIDNLLWAPVNVGATYLPASKTSFTNDSVGELIAGLYFQWGRNYPGIKARVVTPAKITTVRFASLEEALASDYWFTNSPAGTGVHWLATPDYTLWSGANAQGPCPDGWRVPTMDEIKAVTNATHTNKRGSAASGWWGFESKADASQTLWLPCTGSRPNNNGSLTNFGGGGIVDTWAADKGSTDGNGARLYIPTSGTLNYAQDPCGYGEVVRAVRDIPTP
jgi:hypothetical protein